MLRRFLSWIFAFIFFQVLVFPSVQASVAHDSVAQKLVYVFPIRENIMPSVWRMTEQRLKEANEMNADVVLIEMNTYGGLVDAADSIRTAILNYPKPVFVFINNQAASAGALIAIAADSIYMRQGASIGAASVVDQNGQPLPEKMQSFMRGIMRSTAQAHGRIIEKVKENGDTVWRWHRDPDIAEAMVGVYENRTDGTEMNSQKEPGNEPLTVLTLTNEEALEKGFSEGTASSIAEVLAEAGINDYTIYEYKPSAIDRLLGFLTNPAVQGILIMLIIGGIYFELQTPGVGFPLIVAILGAVLYFAPLYVEGLAAYWEMIIFVIGIVLLILEIFVTPGFGVLGVLGIIAMIAGLSAAAIDGELFRYIPTGEVSLSAVFVPFATVIISVTVGIIAAFYLGKRFLTGHSKLRNKVVLTSSMSPEHGYVSYPDAFADIIGKHAVVTSTLRPSGKVEIDGVYYEAVAEDGFFIERGSQVIITRTEAGILYCKKFSVT